MHSTFQNILNNLGLITGDAPDPWQGAIGRELLISVYFGGSLVIITVPLRVPRGGRGRGTRGKVMRNAFLSIAAAIAIAGVPAAAGAAAHAKLRLPPPKAPKNQILAPGAVAKDLKARGYGIEKMKRLGTTYSVTATGPHRNKVQLTIDGRSGDIIGLAVLQAAPNLATAIAAIVKSAKGSRYIDDSHPFGVIVPTTYQTRWVDIAPSVWSVFTAAFIPELWSWEGYRFAVPYQTIRPGYGGYSYTTFAVADMGSPVYDVYDYNGSSVSTSYSESSYELTQTSTYESTYSSQNTTIENSYLDGSIDAQSDETVDEVTDYDSEDGDFDTADNANDGYDADVDEADDQGVADEPDEGGDQNAVEPDEGGDQNADEPDDSGDQNADEPDDSGGDNADEPDDSGDPGADEAEDLGGDGGDGDDGGDEPEAV